MRKVAIVAAAFAACMMTSASYSASYRVGVELNEKAAPNKKRAKAAVNRKKIVKSSSKKAKVSSKKKASSKIVKKASKASAGAAKLVIKPFKYTVDQPVGTTSYLRSHFQKSFGIDLAASEPEETDGIYHPIIDHYAEIYGVPVELARAVVRVESNYRPDALGSAGEIGLMQIKPATARLMGHIGPDKLLFHPVMNVKFGMRYLAKAHALGDGSVCDTILKYNAGHSAKRMNPVSSAYCSKVKELV